MKVRRGQGTPDLMVLRQKLIPCSTHNRDSRIPTIYSKKWLLIVSRLASIPVSWRARDRRKDRCDSSPFFDVLAGDLGAYDRWAKRIVEEGWLGKEVFYQDPLYPYFLAVLYKIVGRDFFWIYTIQAFLGAWTAVLLVLLGLILWFIFAKEQTTSARRTHYIELTAELKPSAKKTGKAQPRQTASR